MCHVDDTQGSPIPDTALKGARGWYGMVQNVMVCTAVAYPGLVLVGVFVARHEKGVRQVGLLHGGPVPFLHGAWEVVVVLDEPGGAEELYPLVVAVRRLAANLRRGREREGNREISSTNPTAAWRSCVSASSGKPNWFIQASLLD